MSKALHASITEETTIDEMDRAIDRLARELTCLIELGVLSDEEETALSAILGDLRVLLVRVWRAESHDPGDARRTHGQRAELCRMLRTLNCDIDLAYGRLSAAR